MTILAMLMVIVAGGYIALWISNARPVNLWRSNTRKHRQRG
jgi:hypothetical protein